MPVCGVRTSLIGCGCARDRARRSRGARAGVGEGVARHRGGSRGRRPGGAGRDAEGGCPQAATAVWRGGGRARHRRSMLTALFDLMLPRRCAGCATARATLCPRCRERFAGDPRPHRPRPPPPGLPRSWAVTTYDGPVRAAIVAYKERGRRDLAGPLGAALARAVLGALAQPEPPDVGASRGGAAAAPSSGPAGAVRGAARRPRAVGRGPGGAAGARAVVAAPAVACVLVPVPSRRAAAIRRGGDPARRLAVAATAALAACGVEAVCRDALRHVRAVADQAGLGAAARAANLAGALAVRSARTAASLAALARDVPVIVVDDVVTTGATLTEAARALRAAGIPVAAAAVVAATPRRAGSPGSPAVPVRGRGFR